MQFVSGHLYFIKDSFFEYVDDPNLMINYQNSSRPHYYAVRDRKTNLYWMIPCSTRVEKYEQILEKKKALWSADRYNKNRKNLGTQICAFATKYVYCF